MCLEMQCSHLGSTSNKNQARKKRLSSRMQTTSSNAHSRMTKCLQIEPMQLVLSPPIHTDELTPSIDEEFTKVSRERLHCQRDTLKSLVCIFKLGFDQFQILRNNMIGAIEIEIFRQFCVCSG